MRILYVADAAPVNLIAEGLIRGLRANGHEVLSYGPGLDVFYGFEVPLKNALDIYNWRGPRFYPDLVWYSDSKLYPQWADLDCPRVLTWVDPNCFDATELVRDADAVFIFKKQYEAAVHALNNHTWWLPYGVDDTVYFPDLTTPRMHGVVCVGTLDDQRRALWLPLQERLGEHMLIANEVWGEDLALLYRQAEVVLDWHRSNVWGDRTMMALACGACNCTNAVPGLLDVFRAEEHVVVYEPQTLAQTIEALLADEPRRRRIAAEGCKEVLLRHTWRQRSAEMLARMREHGVLPAAVRLPSIPIRPA
jgi:glycosyltransferase involved in cell wall biosynthesis